MALLIQPEHHAVFTWLLAQSSRLRGRDSDPFDGRAGIHLLTFDGGDRLAAAVRLTPSTEPTVSREILTKHMGVTMPCGPHIVEMSPICTDPKLSKDECGEAMLDLRLGINALFLQRGWTHSIGVGYDRHIQPLVRCGMRVEILGPPVILPGDREPSFAVMASDPCRQAGLADPRGGRPVRLQDPGQDPSLIVRYGDRQDSLEKPEKTRRNRS